MLNKTKTNGVGRMCNQVALRVRAFFSHQPTSTRNQAPFNFCALSQRATHIADYSFYTFSFFVQKFRLKPKLLHRASWAGFITRSLSALTRKDFMGLSWDKMAVKLTESNIRHDKRWQAWACNRALGRFKRRLRMIGIIIVPSSTTCVKDGYVFTWHDDEGARGKMYASWHCAGCLDTYESYEIKSKQNIGNFILDVREFDCALKFREKVMGVWGEEVRRAKIIDLPSDWLASTNRSKDSIRNFSGTLFRV